jgi:alkylhydroperoxidase/carboxymuconolactone decarboxylase family protein YurZ
MTHAIVTAELLKLLSDEVNLPKHVWCMVTIVTLSALNRPKEIPNVLEYLLKHDTRSEDEQTRQREDLLAVRRIREGLIKSSAVVGMPKVINAIHALKSATPPNLFDDSKSNPTSRPYDIDNSPPLSILARGQAFFDKTYGKVAGKIINDADSSGCPDLSTLIKLIYGYIVSDISVLNPMETSFAIVAGLIPQDVNPQLIGHLHGAINNGATKEQVATVRRIVITICKAAGMKTVSGDDGQPSWGWTEEVASL